MMLSWQPEGAWGQEGANDVISSLGATGLVDALAPFLWVVPLVIGLVFSFTFDTTGPRTRIVDADSTVYPQRVATGDRHAVPDEDVHDYRRDDETVAAELRDRDRHALSDEDYRRDEETVAGELRERDTAHTADTRVDRDRI
jgi:hypothetical protein